MSTDSVAYRVKLYGNGRYAAVTRIGMNKVESLADGVYSYQTLPEWMRDKLAALSILRPPPPFNDVEGVGQRVSAETFWVYE